MKFISTALAFIMMVISCESFRTPSIQIATRKSSNLNANRAQLEMAYKKVFVAGAAKGVGRQIVEQLVAKDVEVVAFVRREEAKQELGGLKGVTAILGDALVQKDVEGAMDGCDAAVTTLGSAPTDEQRWKVDYDGNVNVIEAAGILGVTRCILVTSVGCGDSKEAVSPDAYEKLENALKAKEKAERVLTKYYTNSDWTVIRPGGLMNGEATSAAVLTENKMACGVINRADVASLVVKALDSQKTFRKVLTAVDPTVETPFPVAEVELDPIQL